MRLRILGAWWTVLWALTPPSRKRRAVERDLLEARMWEGSE